MGWPREMTAAALVCGSCGTELPPNSKFCNECGARLRRHETGRVQAGHGAVRRRGAFDGHRGCRWCRAVREIMAELVERCAAVVSATAARWTSSPATGSWRCSARRWRWRITPFVPVLRPWDSGGGEAACRRSPRPRRCGPAVAGGLNSGQVIAGEIGSGAFGYTAIGEQVGMAQRMESVAPPGGVMLSASTARLVDGAATLGESELVQIKGADEPVPARRLLGMGDGHRAVGRAESSLVGRRWEMSAVEGLLDRAIDGHGAVVGVVGSPGIGKSRLVREAFGAWHPPVVSRCSPPSASRTPARFPSTPWRGCLRVAFGVEGLDTRVARDGLRDRIADADPEDLLLLDDLLGIGDPDAVLPGSIQMLGGGG